MSNLMWLFASIPCAVLVGLAVWGFISREYLRKGYEPIVDYDALQDELDAEFSPLTVEQGARLV